MENRNILSGMNVGDWINRFVERSELKLNFEIIPETFARNQFVQKNIYWKYFASFRNPSHSVF